MPYRILGHTADVLLKIYGKTRRELCVDGAKALFSVMTSLRKGNPKELKHWIELSSENFPLLFHAWLNEHLYLFTAEGIVLVHYTFVRLNETQLKAWGTGYRFDPNQDEQRLEVKAITFYRFRVEKRKGKGWVAEVVLDI